MNTLPTLQLIKNTRLGVCENCKHYSHNGVVPICGYLRDKTGKVGNITHPSHGVQNALAHCPKRKHREWKVIPTYHTWALGIHFTSMVPYRDQATISRIGIGNYGFLRCANMMYRNDPHLEDRYKRSLLNSHLRIIQGQPNDYDYIRRWRLQVDIVNGTIHPGL